MVAHVLTRWGTKLFMKLAKLTLALPFCAMCACGGGVEQPDPPPQPVATPVSSDFTGRWYGALTTTAAGQAPYTNPNASFVLNARGSELAIVGICADGSGVITAHGQGRSVSWDGAATCAYSTPTCAYVTDTYVSATIALDASGALTLVAYANLVGCGMAFATTSTFTGRK